MQLTTQHENIDDEETRHNSRQPMKIKYGHRYRRKKMIHADSEDTVLEFDEDEDTKTQLPDLIQDTDLKNESNFTNTTTVLSDDHCVVNVPTIELTLEKYDSSNISNSPIIKVIQKRFSLPNDTVIFTSRQSHSLNNSPNIKVTKKKFSLPGDISVDHNINNRAILDVDNLRKIYNSSTSLPSDTYKSDGLNIDGSLRKKYCSTDGSECRCRVDSKVGEFVQEVIFSISEISHGNPGDGVRKLRGIIKKTLSCEKDDSGSNVICIKRQEKCKNTVHFSEENITIEIPRPSKPYFRKFKDKMNYFCCFGFLFPSA